MIHKTIHVDLRTSAQILAQGIEAHQSTGGLDVFEAIDEEVRDLLQGVIQSPPDSTELRHVSSELLDETNKIRESGRPSLKTREATIKLGTLAGIFDSVALIAHPLNGSITELLPIISRLAEQHDKIVWLPILDQKLSQWKMIRADHRQWGKTKDRLGPEAEGLKRYLADTIDKAEALERKMETNPNDLDLKEYEAWIKLIFISSYGIALDKTLVWTLLKWSNNPHQVWGI